MARLFNLTIVVIYLLHGSLGYVTLSHQTNNWDAVTCSRASHAEGSVFNSRPQQTIDVNVNVVGHRE